jgi:hypothetical protein
MYGGDGGEWQQHPQDVYAGAEAYGDGGWSPEHRPPLRSATVPLGPPGTPLYPRTPTQRRFSDDGALWVGDVGGHPYDLRSREVPVPARFSSFGSAAHNEGGNPYGGGDGYSMYGSNPLYAGGGAAPPGPGVYGYGQPQSFYGPVPPPPYREASLGPRGGEMDWRGMQARLEQQALAAKQQRARQRAGERAAQGSTFRRLSREVSYLLRRGLYLVDRRAGSFAFQVMVLAGFATVWSLAYGKVLMEVRNKEWAKSAEVSYTTYSEGVWLAWCLLTDPGWGVWPDTGATGLWLRTCCELNVIIGLLFLATIVGIIADAVSDKMHALKKGLIAVREARHSVVLGWGEAALTVVKELALANASEGGGVVVVLAENDKEEMERDLESFMTVPELHGTEVVFRTGSRLHKTDLSFVACKRARSITVLSNMGLDADTADAEMLQVVLNLTTIALDPSCVVAAEVRDKDNEPLVARLGTGLVSTVPSHDICGRLMLLFVRQPGLARVYSSILGFKGTEFYVQHWPQVVGTQWQDVCLHFVQAIPIGIRRPDGSVQLNPHPGYCVAQDDALVVLSEDNDTYTWEEAPHLGGKPLFRSPLGQAAVPECVLIAGWRRDLAYLILMLDNLVGPGSELHILCELPLKQRLQEFAGNAFDPDTHLVNLQVHHHVGSPVLSRCVEQLPIQRLTSAVIMADASDDGHSDSINSDSQCLSALMLLRGMQVARMRQRAHMPAAAGGVLAGGRDVMSTMMLHWDEGEALAAARQMPMVVEIMDPRTQKTVSDSYMVWSIADFIQSNELISKMLAMISEEPAVKRIMDELMGETGTQFELQAAEKFIAPDAQCCFLQLARECSANRHVVLAGYIQLPEPGSRELAPMVINPTNKLELRTWRGCTLIVITTKQNEKAGGRPPRAWAASPQNFPAGSDVVPHEDMGVMEY